MTKVSIFSWPCIKVIKTTVLLRLSIILAQQRSHHGRQEFQASAERNSITLVFSQDWLTERPIIEAELSEEQQLLLQQGILLIVGFY